MFLKKNYFNYFNLLQKRKIVLGRASNIGTKYFLEQSKIPFIYTLKGSNLNINPIIINTPLHRNTDKELINDLYVNSILSEKYNCFHVYSRKNKNDIWYTTCLNDLAEVGLDREGFVTIAELGKVETKDELMQVLEEAWSLTEQEYIDIVTLDYNDDWKAGYTGQYKSIVNFLEELCQKEILHSYGFKLDIEPFNHHTPPLGGHFGNVRVPISMEQEIRDNLPNCDLVFYPLSPTIAVPTPTSMLPPENDDIEYGSNESDYVQAIQDSTDDSMRRFTRVAVNPFSCYRGHGEEEDDDDEEREELAQKDPDAVKAALESEKKREYIEGKQEPSGCPQPDDPALYLIDQVIPQDFSQSLHELLDNSVPKLKTSNSLQEKVLRICLSYGHEICCVEPEILNLLGPINIQKSDLLTIDEAGLIFGGFMIPKEVNDLLRDMNNTEDTYDRYGRTYDVEPESDEELEMLRQGMLEQKRVIEENRKLGIFDSIDDEDENDENENEENKLNGKTSTPIVPFAPQTVMNSSPKPSKYKKHSSSRKKKTK